MKKRVLSLILAFCLIIGLMPTAALAANAPWAADAVNALNEIYGSGVFSADDATMTEGDAYTVLQSMGATTTGLTSGSTTALTRTKACTVLATIFKLPVTGSGANAAIQYLYGQNIVNGKAPNNLAENDPIKKAEFSVLAYRILNATGGGKGSATALKPGTEEYFAWMYLAARACVPFDVTRSQLDTKMSDITTSTFPADTRPERWQGKTGDELWNVWAGRLKELYSSFIASNFNADDTLLQAAVRMTKAMTDADGSSYIFTDVTPTSDYFWAYDGIMYLFDQRYVSGTGNGTFEPAGTMPRWQFAALLIRIDGSPQSGETSDRVDVSDVPDPFKGMSNMFQAAVARGYLDPPAGSKFADWWSQEIPREEAIVAILKMCVHKYSISLDTTKVNASILDRFTDLGSVVEANKPYLAYAVSCGLLKGTSATTLAPTATCTRAEIGVLLYRALVGLDTSKMKDYSDNIGYAKGE